MTLDYICHLTQEEVNHPASREQWASQYHWLVATDNKKQADALREKWKVQYTQDNRAPGEVVADREWQSKLGLSPGIEILPVLADLPANSFIIRFTFKLQKPYLSKDDDNFHIIDNPLVRETVFRWPMVCASSWKGSLRHALWQLGHQEDNDEIRRILGEIRSDDLGQAGRLYVYPTFFERSGLEIINPHDRERRIGKNPILIECVPPGIIGDFLLLYTPFYCIRRDEQETHKQVAEDLEVLALGIQAMLTTYGFGAKTSSGFGTAEDTLSGKGTLALRAELTGLATSTGTASEPGQPAPSLPRHLESPTRLRADFRQTDGSLKSEAEYEAFVKSRGGQYRKKDKLLYKKAQKWWEREGRQLAEATMKEPTPEPALTQTPPMTELTFASLDELRELAQGVATQLRNGGKA